LAGFGFDLLRAVHGCDNVPTGIDKVLSFYRARISFLFLTLFWPAVLQAQLSTGTVDFDVASLRDQTQVTINLSDSSTLVLLRDYVVDDGPGKYTWIGFVQDDVNGRAFITVNAPNAVGSIHTSTKFYKLTITEAATEPVQEIDTSTSLPLAAPLRMPIFSDSFEGQDLALLVDSPMADCDDTAANIDVMVLYTDDAAALSPTIETEIDLAIRKANDSFTRSNIKPEVSDGIELKLNLVHKQMVQVNESPDTTADELLSDFRENRAVTNVHQLRDQYSADLVFLLARHISDYCGLASFITSNDYHYEKFAFAVLKSDCFNDDRYSFTHEMGHLFGLDHDKYALLQDANPPLNPDLAGSNYGYSYVGPGFPWKTIMAYDNECKDVGFPWCPTLNFFSNPNDMHAGVPRGVEGTDNRKQLIDAADVRACYRDRPAPPTQTVSLNDTGIDWGGNYPSGNNANCTGETITAQDCSHGRDATHNDDSDGHAGFSFTKLDANGNALPASAPAWSCVRDEVTGLTWEVKTDDSGLRDTDNTYSWYNPDSYTNGGDPGIQNGGSCAGSNCDTYSYVQAVNAVTQPLCGARDWRMPWREELHSIVDLGRALPAIDTAYFPYQRNSVVWSGSPYAHQSTDACYACYAWGFDFSFGYDDSYGRVVGSSRFSNNQVRLVRGGQ